MEKTITGPAYVLGDDIDTDQIIPAEYLSYDPTDPEERKYFGMYACSGVPAGQRGRPNGDVPFVNEGQFHSEFRIVIGGSNFGCGSSREHAPLAIAEAGAQVVVAQFFARIFYRNCVNGGYLLPLECHECLIDGAIETGDLCTVDLAAATIGNERTGVSYPLQPIGDALPIIEAGGVFEYARRNGMLDQNA